MSSNQHNIMKLRMEISDKESQLRKLEESFLILEEEITYMEESLDDEVETLAYEYTEAEQEKIKEKYEPLIEALEDEIDGLTDALDVKEVDDTEEYVEAKRRREYLNTSAGLLNSYHAELARISSPYFIDLAYVEKDLTLKQFTKVFKSIPDRINEMKNMREELYPPFSRVEKSVENKGINSAYYFWSTIGSPMTAIGAPVAFIKSIRRAQYLHEAAQLYHKLMHSLIALRDKTDAEINEIFSKLLKLRSERIEEMLKAKEVELAQLNAKLENELDSVKYNEDEYKRQHAMSLMFKRSELDKLEDQVKELKDIIKSMKEELGELEGERAKELRIIRDKFLQGNEVEDRTVVLPEQLIYDFTPQANTMFSTDPGLYLYNEREIIDQFMRLFVFQVRNVMEYGAVQFRFFDIKDGGFIDGFKLPVGDKSNTQDIFTYSLKEEQTKGIDTIHDMLRRRKGQIRYDNNVGDYNLIQKQNGSSPLSYQLVFIILDDSLKLDEKLKQLVHIGNRLGLYIYIFMKQELMNVNLSKVTQDYISRYIEISPTGLTSYDSIEYTEKLEAQEADRKTGIR